MRNLLSLAIVLALPMAASAGEQDCLVSFAGAQQNVCTGEASTSAANLQNLLSLDAVKDSSLRLVKFSGPITAAQRAAVEAAGARIISYAPYNAYIVRMPAERDHAMHAIDGVNWSGPLMPALKIDPNIYNELKAGNIVSGLGIDALEISLDSQAGSVSLQSAFSSIPGVLATQVINSGDDVRVRATFARAQLANTIEALALRDDVLAVGFHRPVRASNSQGHWLHQSNISSPPTYSVWDKGIYGCGQIIGELDTGVYMDNIAFSDPNHTMPIDICTTGASCPVIAAPNYAARKVVAYYKWSGLSGTGWEDNHGHGTHVAGSIIGNDNGFDLGNSCAGLPAPNGTSNLVGMAPYAKLVMQESGANLAYLNTMGGTPYHAADTAYQNGARIHSNSWGGGCTDQFGACVSGCTVTYDQMARDADSVMADRDDLLVVFAAGNDATACPNGNNVGSPGNAKNVLTIGATGRGTAGNNMASFSSRGPTLDSRTKPDLDAQGSSIISAGRSASGTVTMSGTSMATPTAAGNAALVRDYLANGFYPSGVKTPGDAIPNPSGALIKAILAAGAFKMTGTGANANPGQDQGYGRILLDDSLFFAGDASKLFIHDETTGLQTGGVANFQVTAVGSQRLTFVLNWSDVPGAVNASPATVNSLRLEVQAPNGDVWTQKLPAGYNVNNANPTQSITTTDYDGINTMQRIQFDTPAAGPYQIRVRGINVPTGPQTFALAVTGNFDLSTDPDYLLSPTPGSMSICAGTPASYSIGVRSLYGFTDPVTLSTSSLPGATTSGFSVNPVTPADPAAVSVLTIGNTAGLASGSYLFSIDGISSGGTPISHSTGATLNVNAAIPGAVGLTTPADGATGTATMPAFAWASDPEAQGYVIEVATDSAFTNIVATGTTLTNSWTSNVQLAPNTLHYWRVKANNTCGQSTSTVFSFTTANLICSTVNTAIPDNNTTGLSNSITVADTSTLTNLKVSIKGTHTWVGDLKFQLSRGAGNVMMVDRPGYTGSGFGCSNNDFDIVLDDAATTPVEGQCNATPPALSGVVKPNNPINSVFAGAPFNGTWTLTASDNAGGDTGSLAEWCLIPTTATGATYTVGGSVSGLTGSGLVLSLNAGAQTLPVAADGAFTFPTGLTGGASYAVTVGTQPAGQVCNVSNGSGTIGSANVTDVAVTCTVAS
ncbi:S8 family serine peptidase, partial [Dokdonella sp.]|uniref:S8 family serine peptidase n=1 Tax=Dokdonella sp. TaxID=2291710 RepID=UPI0025C2205F